MFQIDKTIFPNKFIKSSKMKKSHSNFESMFSKTSLCLTKHQLKNEKEGLFACTKQKQFFVERLREGSLFRMSQYVKPEEKVIQKDPYLNWLEENSLNKSQSISADGIKEETQFNANLEVIKKQKNCGKFSFPKISYPNLSQNQASKKFNQNIKQKQSTIKDSNSQSISIHFGQKPIWKSKSNHKGKNQFLLNSKEQSHICQGHKSFCFENKLSKTQLFSKHDESSFNQHPSNMIKSHFYLNDHKKIQFSQNSYMKIQSKAQREINLKRLESYKESFVKPFQENLRKLEKRTNLSCYNEVSKCFSSMRNQMSTLISQLNQNNHYRDKQKQNFKQINLSRDKKGSANSTINRIKTQHDQRNGQSHTANECYLPEFLMKSIILPKKQETIQNSNMKIPQKLRI